MQTKRLLAAAAGVALLYVATQTLWAQQEATDAPARVTELSDRLADLDPRVAHLKARQEILNASKRYTRGADRHDIELARSAFWPDATISNGTPMPRDTYLEWERTVLSDYAAHQHHVTGQTVEFDGDTAHVESYLLYFLVPRDTSADRFGEATPGHALESEKTYLGSGRYIERWERRNGEWRILVREYVEDLALLGETVDLCGGQGCLGTWDRSDLSYARPLEHLTPEQRRARTDANRTPGNPRAGGTTSGSGRERR